MAMAAFAGTRTADQHDVALLGNEATTREVIHERLVDRRALNSKSSRSLASGSLAMVSWYLMERACFSLISALSKSPTILRLMLDRQWPWSRGRRPSHPVVEARGWPVRSRLDSSSDGSEVVVTGTIGDQRSRPRQSGRREDRGRRAGIALAGKDVEDDIGGVNAMGDRFSACGP